VAPHASRAAQPRLCGDPVSAPLVTKYLVRIWPAGTTPPSMQQSEMSSPESATEGQEGNDRAEIQAIRSWAQMHANGEGVTYSYEVCRDSLVAALTGSDTTQRVVATIASGSVEPASGLAEQAGV
jgi:hypothetical protein